MATAKKIPGSFGQSMAEAGLAGPPPKSNPSSSASSPRGRTSPSTLVNIAPDAASDRASDRASKVLQNSLFGYSGTVKSSAGKRRKTKRVVKKRRNRK